MLIAFAHARIQFFTFFLSAYFTEGPICLGPLPVSFLLTENYRQSPCEKPAHDAQKSALKVVVNLVVRLYGISAGLRLWFCGGLGCFHGHSCIVLKMFRYSCVYPGEGAVVSGTP